MATRMVLSILFYLCCHTCVWSQDREIIGTLDSLITDTSMTDSVFIQLELISEVNGKVEEKQSFNYYRRGEYFFYYNDLMVAVKDGKHVVVLEPEKKQMYYYQDEATVNKGLDSLLGRMRGKVIRIEDIGVNKAITCESLSYGIETIVYIIDYKKPFLKEVQYNYQADSQHKNAKKTVYVKYLQVRRINETDKPAILAEFIALNTGEVRPVGKYLTYNFIDITKQ